MAYRPLPDHVDTIVVGNGPSALILSFILHGNIPYYNLSKPHPDPILHSKLLQSPCLLHINAHDLTAHFAASRISYSTQALPINVLLDTLLRPLADTEGNGYSSCVEWRYEPELKIPHIVLGNTPQAGGQWADNPVSASWDIGALSYAEMLSLPGYSYADHFQVLQKKLPAEFHRPTRRETASYLAAYPRAVGIEDSIWTSVKVDHISSTKDGFWTGSHDVFCNHLVLASGIFSHLLPPRPLLQPMVNLPRNAALGAPPLLVVGSGFTAADVIISTPLDRNILHIFKWSLEEHPSPLRACNPQAYPEYVNIYRRMKSAARKAMGHKQSWSRKGNTAFDHRDWQNSYEGLPNTVIQGVSIDNNIATITLRGPDETIFERQVSNLEYVIGRRGSLRYLESDLRAEILGHQPKSKEPGLLITGKTLRSKVEYSLEVSSNVFAIGSLTGDSLIRFAFGGCVFAAREIISRRNTKDNPSCRSKELDALRKTKPIERRTLQDKSNDCNHNTNADDTLTHMKEDRSLDEAPRVHDQEALELEMATCEMWHRSGWWAGSFTRS
ncbi:hypothetical protein MMC20_000485 [Loxospora ochrophaea]|nr:hypothetical protein [Loxospora ochrophaea]